MVKGKFPGGSPAGPLLCPQAHPIMKCKVLRKWQGRFHARACDLCQADIARADSRWRCLQKCNYDLCNNCYEQQRDEADPETVEQANQMFGSSRPDGGTASASNAQLPRTIQVVNDVIKCNGFEPLPEIEPIWVPEEFIAPFSMPQEALTFEPTENQTYLEHADGKIERFIHCNIKLKDPELRLLQALQRIASKEVGLKFFPCVTLMATRQLNTARGDIRRALELMKKVQLWRETYFKEPLQVQGGLKETLSEGNMYFCGRDPELRPIMVVRAVRLLKSYTEKGSTCDHLLKALIFLMEYFMRYMSLPGRIENIVLLIDLAGLSSTQVPLSALKEIYSVMSGSYAGRLYKVYLCNMPWGLRMMMGTAKAILSDRQQRKLNTIGEVSELLQYMAPNQLETDLGGNREIVKTFWPLPVVAGPFALGSSESNPKAVPRCDKVVDRTGVGGRLWDKRRAPCDNTAIDYCHNANEIFEQCGLPPPIRPTIIMEAGLDGGVTPCGQFNTLLMEEFDDDDDDADDLVLDAEAAGSVPKFCSVAWFVQILSFKCCIDKPPTNGDLVIPVVPRPEAHSVPTQ